MVFSVRIVYLACSVFGSIMLKRQNIGRYYHYKMLCLLFINLFLIFADFCFYGIGDTKWMKLHLSPLKISQEAALIHKLCTMTKVNLLDRCDYQPLLSIRFHDSITTSNLQQMQFCNSQIHCEYLFCNWKLDPRQNVWTVD